ncbi:hypothetical protein DEO72_LG7g63 [Vigna unguiculata]|uniref:Uncharacterized protein n=1 Tax=Vigna unguiculata TaxID=3917 RepID=A0A4D6MFG3_VIGUN|nr:hypothetical protein DEO72_LG7g63 [Vigna unguiculata]
MQAIHDATIGLRFTTIPTATTTAKIGVAFSKTIGYCHPIEAEIWSNTACGEFTWWHETLALFIVYARFPPATPFPTHSSVLRFVPLALRSHLASSVRRP